MENISASEVSRIAKKLDKLVKAFLERPIVGSIPYLFVDASYFKVRTVGRYINKALLVVTAIHEDGYREILSASVEDSEDESCWESCFEGLKDRGLTGVKLVIFDGHKGYKRLLKKNFSELLGRCATFISCVLCSRTYRRKIKRRLLTCVRTLLKMRARCRN